MWLRHSNISKSERAYILLQSVGQRSDIGQIPCNRPTGTCQPKLGHDQSLCPFISGTRVRFCRELLFIIIILFFFPFFFFPPPLTPRLAFLFFPSFFCPPLISSSPFPLLPSFFIFYYSFPIHFLSSLLLVSPFLLLFFLSFLPLFYFHDFFLLFLSSFSHSFCFCFSFSPLNFFLVSPLYQGGCYEHKG